MPPSHFRKFDLLVFLLYSQHHLSLTTELRNPHKKSRESIFEPGAAEWEVWTLPLSYALPLLLLIVSLRNYCRAQKSWCSKKFQKRAGGRIFEEIPLMSSMSSTSSSSMLLMSVQMRFIRFRKKSQRDGEGREGLKNGGPVENVGLIRGDRCTHIEWTCSLHHTKMTRHRLLLKGGTSAYCVWWK